MNNELYGWDGGYTRIRATIKLRPVNPHDGSKLRPESRAVDGYTGDFQFAWHMSDDDPYPGEIAWLPAREYTGGDYPNDAPGWIASGDLELVRNLEWGVDYGYGFDDE